MRSLIGFIAATVLGLGHAAADDMTLLGVGNGHNIAAPATPMTTPILSYGQGGSSPPSNTADNYGPIFAGYITGVTWGSVGSGAKGVQVLAPISGTINDLTVVLGTQNATAGTWEFGVSASTYNSATISALNCTVDGSSAGGSGTTHGQYGCTQHLGSPVAVTAGTTFLALVSHPSTGTNPTALSTGGAQISFTFTSTNNNESFVCAISQGAAAASNFISLGSFSSAWNATIANVSVPWPVAGTLDNPTAIVRAAAGAGNSWTISGYKNGASLGWSDLTISGASQTSATATDSVAVAAGDELAIGVPSSVTPASSSINVCMRWRPTTPGQAIVTATVPAAIANSANSFYAASGVSPGGVATEAAAFSIAPVAMTLGAASVAEVTTVPAAGKSWAVSLRGGTAASVSAATTPAQSSEFTDTLANSSTACNGSNSHTCQFGTTTYGASALGLLGWLVAPSTSPTVQAIKFATTVTVP